MTTTDLLNNPAFRQAYARSQRETQGNRPVGLSEGENILWLLQDPNGLVFFRLDLHSGVNPDGYYQPALDLRQVFNPQNRVLLESLVDRVTDEDALFYCEYKDPCTLLIERLQDAGLTNSQIRNFAKDKHPFRQSQYFVNAVFGDTVQIVRLSRKAVVEIQDYKNWGDIVDSETHAVRITGASTGPAPRDREYRSPKIEEHDRPEVILLEPYNLLDLAKRNFMPYKEKVTWLFRSFPEHVEAAKLEPSDFGLDSLVE